MTWALPLFIVTHDLTRAARCVDRVIVLAQCRGAPMDGVREDDARRRSMGATRYFALLYNALKEANGAEARYTFVGAARLVFFATSPRAC